MSVNFNVTLIQPPGYVHSAALGEVWVYLADVLQRCGYAARASVNHLHPGERNIILCAHLLSAQQISQIPPDSIIFNSEKLEQSDAWYMASGAYGEIVRRFFVWDYSARNLERIPHLRKAQIPLYFTPALRKNYPRDPCGPLLFYGCMTQRRTRILQALQAGGVEVGVLKFGCYGVARDEIMYQCRAVLNLHTDDERKVFEPVRCFHPLINGIPVISEDFHDEPMFDVFRQAAFVVGADPVADILALLSDQTAFQAAAVDRCALFAATDPRPDMHQAVQAYLAGLQTLQPAV